MEYNIRSIDNKDKMAMYKISDEEIFRKMMSDIAHKAPIELLQKVFSMTKVEVNDSEVEFIVKLKTND